MSHYQLSFTSRQAMAFFVVCLVALGLSFFFGLMTGLSGRPASAGRHPVEATPAPDPSAEAVHREVEPGTDAVASPTGAPGAGESGEALPGSTPPAVLQTFDDRGSEAPTPVPAPARRALAAPNPTSAGVWIQVASLTSRGEADTLAAALSHKGYRAQIVAAQTGKGRVFRVRVGPYLTEEDAARAAEKLRRQEKIRQTWVVREGA